MASPRREQTPAPQPRSLAEQHRLHRELARSYAVERARAQHPALFLQPRAPSRPEAA